MGRPRSIPRSPNSRVRAPRSLRGSQRGGFNKSEDEEKRPDRVNARISALDMEAQQAIQGVRATVLQAADRGRQLEDLEEQSQQLEAGASQFQKSANRQKWHEYNALMKQRLLYFLLFATFIMLISWGCGVFSGSKVEDPNAAGAGGAPGTGGTGGDVPAPVD